MAKKQNTGQKFAILAVSAGAVVYGAAWLNIHQAPNGPAPATETSVLSGVTTSSVTTKPVTTTTQQQATVPRAKKSRAS